LLEFEGFLSEVKIIKHLSNKSINFIKNFTEFKLKPISKSGRRVFLSNKEVVSLNNTVSSIRKELKQSKIGIKERESNYGYLYIIRTSKGIMKDKYAIKENRGGELLFKIQF
jgi:ribosomal protein S8